MTNFLKFGDFSFIKVVGSVIVRINNGEPVVLLQEDLNQSLLMQISTAREWQALGPVNLADKARIYLDSKSSGYELFMDSGELCNLVYLSPMQATQLLLFLTNRSDATPPPRDLFAKG